MKEIPLTQGFVALVDDADYNHVRAHKWAVVKGASGKLYAYRTVNRTSVYMHKFITGYKFTDHKNGNGLDNRRENLREATKSLNMANTQGRPGTSQFKGVHWATRERKWIAKIGLGKQQQYLGSFVCEEDAARAYNEAASRIFGEFALLNEV